MADQPQEEKKVELEAQLKALEEWQKGIVKELKAINGKLTYFVILSILWILFSFLGSFLR